MLMRILCQFSLLILGVSVATASGNFDVFQSLLKAGQFEEATRVMTTLIEKEKDPAQKSLEYFGLGNTYQALKSHQKAIDQYDQALALKNEVEDLIRIHKGQSLRALSEFKEARLEFQRAESSSSRGARTYLESEFELGEVEMSDKKWSAAQNHFARIEKKMRGDDKYPSLLSHLMVAEIERNKKWVACKWALKLYTKFPGDMITKDWGIDLQSVVVEGKTLGCFASLKDQRTRIKSLQLLGLSDQALKEIQILKSRATPLTMIHIDSLTASFYLSEGRVTEALATILPYYKKESGDVNFFMLLAKIAAQNSEFQMAVGAYNRAYALSRNSKTGRAALFQAAFLSYQFQDYDGSSRKFEDFIHKFPRSGLSHDAKWHLAWIRYLKGDFEGAYTGFRELSGVKTRRRKISNQEKNIYWAAMCLLKMGRTEEAIPLFEKISRDKLLGYYAMAAGARLQGLKVTPDPRGLATNPKGEPLTDLKGGKIATSAATLPALAEAAQDSSVTEENESEDTLKNLETGDDEDSADATDGDKADDVPVADPIDRPFQNATLARRLSRANDLINIGLNDWATWELYEIEKKTSKLDYLKTLISKYEAIQAFNRSSYIAQIYFGHQRGALGMKAEGKTLWQNAYPRAFERSVTTFARAFNVPEEFVWGIMRAESQFKPNIRSPVGALGLMQMMPYTALKVSKILDLNAFQVQQLFDPGVNIRLGTRYLQKLLKVFNASVPLTAAAYNAGPHRVRSWIKSFGNRLDMDEFIEHIPYLETRNYVKKVVHNYNIYQQLYSKSSKKDELTSFLAKPVGVLVTGDVELRERWDDN